jgi:hypothetical protein
MKTTPTLLAIALSTLLFAAAATGAGAPQTFATPEDAAAALVDALGTDKADGAKLDALLGNAWRDVIPDGSVGRKDVDAFLAGYARGHSFDRSVEGRAVLTIDGGWTLPVPLVETDGGWIFDLAKGVDEIAIRRIGRNELATAESARAYHDAQNEYAEADRDGDGVLEYAQQFVSTDGLHDGLYWSDDDSGEISPLGPLFGDELPDGVWHGYRYRILTAQGESAPGGAFDYRIGENMSRGFALIAWPAEYAHSGVTSFMISHDGLIFEKDLGPDGAAFATSVATFDPDDSWKESDPPFIDADDAAPEVAAQ